MGTFATVKFIRHDEIVRIGITSDGYPEALGNMIRKFLVHIQSNVRQTRFDDPGGLAAKFVVYMSAITNSESRYRSIHYGDRTHPLDFLGVYIINEDAGAYIYTVTCEGMYPVVKAFDAHGVEIAIPEKVTPMGVSADKHGIYISSPILEDAVVLLKPEDANPGRDNHG